MYLEVLSLLEESDAGRSEGVLDTGQKYGQSSLSPPLIGPPGRMADPKGTMQIVMVSWCELHWSFLDETPWEPPGFSRVAKGSRLLLFSATNKKWNTDKIVFVGRRRKKQ